MGTRRVGRATRTLTTAGAAQFNVRIPLNAATRRRVRTSLPGRPVSVRVTGQEFGVPVDLTGTATTRVVPPSVTNFDITFPRGAATPTAAGRSAARRVARLVGTARRVTCTGFADRNPRSAAGRRLAAGRARAACAALRRAGLTATVPARGLAHGRRRIARSRRVRLLIQR